MSEITISEYISAVRAARAECNQEISAAAAEFKSRTEPFVRARKERGRAARDKRNQRLSELHAALLPPGDRDAQADRH